jgi:uncharacterized protein YbjT (DUF2867 family)
MEAQEVLVTGGTGLLGQRVVECLRDAGQDVRVLSRSGRPGTVRGDLITGEGLERAVGGGETVVHCASSPIRTRRTDIEGTKGLLRTAEKAGVSHLVFISVVGVARNRYFPYYRMKHDAEQVVERSPVPHTILRATQFHEFVLRFIRLLGRGPVAFAPKGFLFQPIDVSEVADRLAELALAAPAGRVPDVGGPEVRGFADLARAYFRATGHGRRMVEMPVPGRAARAFRGGAQLCPDRRYGRLRWEEFLRQTVQPSRD